MTLSIKLSKSAVVFLISSLDLSSKVLGTYCVAALQGFLLWDKLQKLTVPLASSLYDLKGNVLDVLIYTLQSFIVIALYYRSYGGSQNPHNRLIFAGQGHVTKSDHANHIYA